MTSRPTHTTAYPNPKDERRGTFFSSPKKLSRAFGKSASPDPSVLATSPFLSNVGRSSSPASFQSQSTASSSLSPTTSQGSQRRSKTPKGKPSASPQVVSSILNGMYAYPVNRQERSLSSRPAREAVQPSPYLHAIHQPSMSTIELSRTSSDTKSQQLSRTVNDTKPSIRRYNVEEVSRPSWDTDSLQSSQNVDHINSSIESHSAASANSISVNFRESNSLDSVLDRENEAPSTSSSQKSTSTLRVVGRGGSDSRLPLVSSAIEALDPALVRRDLPLVRPIGRDSSGSRPKPLGQPLTLAKDSLEPKPSLPEEPVLTRPTSRGGLGSLPTPSGTLPTFLKILNNRKSNSSKGKGRTAGPPRIHPIPPHLSSSYQIENDSMSTHSSIHFAGETGPPATPFFSSDPSIRSMRSSPQISLSRADSASSSVISDLASTMTTTIPDGESGAEIEIDDDEMEPSQSVDHAQRSLNKLTRTLGDIPSHAHKAGPTLRKEHSPIDNTPSQMDRTTKTFRRNSISITNLGSIFVRPSGRVRDSVASHQTMTTLADDLSERRGYHNGSSADLSYDAPGSPIIFSPPSPIPVGNHTTESSNLRSLQGEQVDDSLSLPSPTLSRSRSYTAARRQSIHASHNHSASASLLAVDSNGTVLTSNWMIPPLVDDGEVAFAVPRNVQEKPQSWTGEWNSDMQDVIRSLRTLR